MNCKLFFILSTFLIVGCKPEDYSGDTHSGSKVMVIGHGGMGIQFSMPMNSLGSIRAAIDIGCDGSEIDIQMTLDSVLVAFHDDHLEQETNCKMRVVDQNWNDLKNCKYDQTLNPQNVYRVDEIFREIPNLKDYYFSFDCKTDMSMSDKEAYENRLLRAIQRLCDQFGMTDQVFVEGGEYFLQKAKAIGLKNRLFLFSNNDDKPIDKAIANSFFGISTTAAISEEDVKRAAASKIYVMIWNPGNYSENKNALKKGTDIIQTDDPISILKLLKRYNYENVRP